MSIKPIACVALLMAACASTERLSASIYDHEERALALETGGRYVEAAAYRRQAERERERLATREGHVVAMSVW